MYNVTITRAGRASFACLAGLAFVILSASFAEADYGPRTTSGANYQQWSNTTSINLINEGSCNGVFICAVLLQVPPQQKSLIVQYVSCRVDVNTGELRNGLLVTRKGKPSCSGARPSRPSIRAATSGS